MFLVLLARHPHHLERAQGSQDGPAGHAKLLERITPMKLVVLAARAGKEG